MLVDALLDSSGTVANTIGLADADLFPVSDTVNTRGHGGGTGFSDDLAICQRTRDSSSLSSLSDLESALAAARAGSAVAGANAGLVDEMALAATAGGHGSGAFDISGSLVSDRARSTSGSLGLGDAVRALGLAIARSALAVRHARTSGRPGADAVLP